MPSGAEENLIEPFKEFLTFALIYSRMLIVQYLCVRMQIVPSYLNIRRGFRSLYPLGGIDVINLQLWRFLVFQ